MSLDDLVENNSKAEHLLSMIRGLSIKSRADVVTRRKWLPSLLPIEVEGSDVKIVPAKFKKPYENNLQQRARPCHVL